MADAPRLAFDSPEAWREWLAEHHDAPEGVWLKIAKKASGVRTVTAPEALDVALCFGWIDGQRRALDDTHFLQRYTPRRPRSKWSQINRDKAERLIEAGEMQTPGLAEVERARADGRWDAAYEPQSRATIPEDLQAALDGTPAAAERFASLSSQNRYAILFRLRDAKRPETRARRLERFVAMLERGETPYPQ
ncbi:MAG TPA: YdeI/OmpD-associated family protein [Solirubrobacteraceae bacterium]|nr:YdeI/OmpD-associated family protein [Solirubrobacteraceae bacterium]